MKKQIRNERLVALEEQLNEILFEKKKVNSHPIRRQVVGAPMSAAISAPKGEKGKAFLDTLNITYDRDKELKRVATGAGLLGGAAYLQGKRADAAYLKSKEPKPVNRRAAKELKKARKGKTITRGRGAGPLFSPRLRGLIGAAMGSAIGAQYNAHRMQAGKKQAENARKWEERGRAARKK